MGGISLAAEAATACDVWVAPLARFAAYARELDAVLSATDRAHVDRHRRQHDRARARVSRSLLRLLLGEYLELEPHEIDLDRRCFGCAAPHGKPRLRSSRRLHFSVAHCADRVVFAFDGSGPVGVDVEPIASAAGTPSPELLELALTPAERRHVSEAPPPEQWTSFLWYWTCKEAVLKQIGTGLSVPLSAVDVGPPRRDGRVWLDADACDGAEVWATGLNLGETHVGALATATEPTELRIAEVPVTLIPVDTARAA